MKKLILFFLLTGCNNVNLPVNGLAKPVHKIGTCLRDSDYDALPKELGYYYLVVARTERYYVLCQGQYGSGLATKEWYGCGLMYATQRYNEMNTVACPKWPIVDEVYGPTRTRHK